jgi:hypothetical protein
MKTLKLRCNAFARGLEPESWSYEEKFAVGWPLGTAREFRASFSGSSARTEARLQAAELLETPRAQIVFAELTRRRHVDCTLL